MVAGDGRTTEERFKSYCRSELERAGLFDKDSDYGGMLGKAVMELVETFEKQGHSGFSASTVLQIFQRVASWKPLTPLTGEDDEWGEPLDGLLQNKRDSRIFKEVATGRTFNVEGKVFRKKGESNCWQNKDSQVDIEFPYWPEDPEIIEE